jgi:hypothetical protein
VALRDAESFTILLRRIPCRILLTTQKSHRNHSMPARNRERAFHQRNASVLLLLAQRSFAR